MTEAAKSGIVILNYNDYETTASLCERIKGYDSVNKIVVVDNKSPDNSFEKLQRLSNEKIDVIQSDKNAGYSYGNNLGAFYLIEKYNIDFLFVANPDVEFTNNFVKNIVENFTENDIAAITGIMTDKFHKPLLWNSRIKNYVEDLIDCTVLIKKVVSNNSMEYAKETDDFIYVDFLPGSLFAIRADVFKKIDGFDDGIFLYYEEQILSTKLKKIGLKVAILKSQEFVHNHSTTINKNLQKINQLKYVYKSLLYYYDNYTDISALQRFILKCFMSYGIFMRRILYRILY